MPAITAAAVAPAPTPVAFFVFNGTLPAIVGKWVAVDTPVCIGVQAAPTDAVGAAPMLDDVARPVPAAGVRKFTPEITFPVAGAALLTTATAGVLISAVAITGRAKATPAAISGVA